VKKKLFWKRHKVGNQIRSYSVWMDDLCVAYGIRTCREAELSVRVAAVMLERSGVPAEIDIEKTVID
jgi:hypothetical protein